MSDQKKQQTDFDIVVVAQAGRLTYEAVLFAASLRHSAPDFDGTLFVAEPQPGPLWTRDPRIADEEAVDLLDRLGATLLPFENRHFGATYPHGNKIEALAALPSDRPFVYFDTDTLITGPIDRVAFDFNRPSASMARENTWPEPQLYGPDIDDIWKAAYAHFDVPFDGTCDASYSVNHWKHYLYFNAGWFYYKCPKLFYDLMIKFMTGLKDDFIPELTCQSFDPWLDQAALPIAIAALGGGRPGPELAGLDGEISCHWRAIPLLYARESDEAVAVLEAVAQPNRVKKVLKSYEPFKRMIYQRRGDRVRALFDRNNLPKREKAIRGRIKRQRLWMR